MSGKSSGARHRVRGKKGNRRLFVRSQTRCNPDRLKPSRSIRTFNGRRPDRWMSSPPRTKKKNLTTANTLSRRGKSPSGGDLAPLHRRGFITLQKCNQRTRTDRIRCRSRRRVREKNQPAVLGEKPDARECQNNWKSAGASVL
jgi:hypothetical protein